MKVHLRDEGPKEDKSPIVLVHGTGSSLHAWEGWTQALKDKRRVIRFDLPGFGLTGPSPDGVYSSDNDIGVLIAILDKLRVDHCVLGGASLGGGIAWRAALTRHRGWRRSSSSMREATQPSLFRSPSVFVSRAFQVWIGSSKTSSRDTLSNKAFAMFGAIRTG